MKGDQPMKRVTLMLAVLTLLLGGVGQVRAEFIITFSQDGANVDANGKGSLNVIIYDPFEGQAA
jgi:hypothetical protein